MTDKKWSELTDQEKLDNILDGKPMYGEVKLAVSRSAARRMEEQVQKARFVANQDYDSLVYEGCSCGKDTLHGLCWWGCKRLPERCDCQPEFNEPYTSMAEWKDALLKARQEK